MARSLYRDLIFIETSEILRHEAMKEIRMETVTVTTNVEFMSEQWPAVYLYTRQQL